MVEKEQQGRLQSQRLVLPLPSKSNTPKNRRPVHKWHLRPRPLLQQTDAKISATTVKNRDTWRVTAPNRQGKGPVHLVIVAPHQDQVVVEVGRRTGGPRDPRR